ncbi:hypothetical protein MMC31_007866, partial [Peltigera leucophlebia]|nr:hypothetical protein [Peltigera leucophlebia]
PTSYWAGTVAKAYSSLLEPSELVQDYSDYLCMFTVISIEGGDIRQDEVDEVGHSGWDE